MLVPVYNILKKKTKVNLLNSDIGYLSRFFSLLASKDLLNYSAFESINNKLINVIPETCCAN